MLNETAHADFQRYLRHQAKKVRHINDHANADHFLKYHSVVGRLNETLRSNRVQSVLCLGARRGAEVHAFRCIGLFAFGIDLEPLSKNAYVAWGDFHSLAFVKESIECVFTNSIDHSLYPEKMLGEIHRVLRPNGLFILQAPNGSEDVPAALPGPYEVFWWQGILYLRQFVEASGFDCVWSEASNYPHRRGEMIVYRKVNRR